MRSDHSDAASSAFSVVTGFTGLVLAFSLVQAQGNLRTLETQVSAEAHDLAQLDRLLVRYGDQNVAAIRAPLHEYANSILTDEWPQLRKGRSSEQTAALFRPVSRGILAIEPPAGRQTLIYAEILKKVDELAADAKTEQARPPISDFPDFLGHNYLLGGDIAPTGDVF